MGAVASQITSLTIFYSTVDSDADQSKHQSSTSLAFVRGIRMASNTEMFPFDHVIIGEGGGGGGGGGAWQQGNTKYERIASRGGMWSRTQDPWITETTFANRKGTRGHRAIHLVLIQPSKAWYTRLSARKLYFILQISTPLNPKS